MTDENPVQDATLIERSVSTALQSYLILETDSPISTCCYFCHLPNREYDRAVGMSQG